MSIDYTNFNSQSMSGYSSVDDDLDAIDFLKDSSNFRPFNKGLKEIIIKKGLKVTQMTIVQLLDILFPDLVKLILILIKKLFIHGFLANTDLKLRLEAARGFMRYVLP